MGKRHAECDESQLAVLLEGDELSDAFRRSAAHLETCESCRTRLTALAADHATWDEASTLLRGYDTSAGSATGSRSASLSRSSSDVANLDIGFLSPPAHPEMLGRLGRYEIEEVIGSGGMGIVLKGHDTELNRPVAIKVLAPHLAHNGAARQRFAREGRAAAAVVHEHVVAIHNVETDAQMPFLVMQYVPGEALQKRVDERGPLSTREILRIGFQAASGLSAAHAQGVVHRDIKPSNILLEYDVDRALLTDFGLARVADDATMTRTGIVAGTPHYMSPEQASGGPVGERSDLFSLGAVLYFMATGHPPFRAERAMAVLHRTCHDRHRPVWEVNADIPDELSDIIDRLLEKKPRKRFASAEQTKIALLGLLEKLQQPGGYRRRSRLRRWMHRRRRPIAVGSCAIIGIAAVALGLSTVFDFGSSDVGRPQSSATDAPAEPANGRPRVPLLDTFVAGLNSSNEFVAETAAVIRDLQAVEAANTGNNDLFWRPATSKWHSDVAALRHDLSEVEENLSTGFQSEGKE
jgi:eukaryotic-like serine/threonine-protein kinase